jgi:hypothetical protein
MSVSRAVEWTSLWCSGAARLTSAPDSAALRVGHSPPVTALVEHQVGHRRSIVCDRCMIRFALAALRLRRARLGAYSQNMPILP